MLVETKVKSEMIVDNKVRKVTETFILDTTFFSTAEYSITEMLEKEKEAGTLKDYEIQSLRISPIKEIANQYHGEHSYLATLKDIWTDDDGTEKHLKYKVLLWANDLQEAITNAHEMAKEGYEMLVESLKEVDYVYLGSAVEFKEEENE
jgi:anaerobic ribonucleoside-triphosphate reductase